MNKTILILIILFYLIYNLNYNVNKFTVGLENIKLSNKLSLDNMCRNICIGTPVVHGCSGIRRDSMEDSLVCENKYGVYEQDNGTTNYRQCKIYTYGNGEESCVNVSNKLCYLE